MMRVTKIMAHPENIAALKAKIPRECLEGLFAVEIVPCPLMEREKWTGKYILPSGAVVEPKDVRVPWGRFAELGESDIKILLWAGLIRKQMEMKFVMIDDRFRMNWMNFEPVIAAPFSAIMLSTV